LAFSQGNFNAICEAYEVLSDLTRKDCYDKYGENGLKNGIPSYNEDTKTYDKKIIGGYCFKGNTFDIF
jgi:DnaJ-class molecular chaperone